MITAVLFDAGGVLHVSDHVLEQEFKTSLGISDDQVAEMFSHYIPLLGTSKITEQQLWDELQRRWGIRHVSVDEHLFTKSFERNLQKMPGMYEYIDDLKGQGITVGLLTNASPQFASVLSAHGHYDPFTVRIISHEVGLWKPDPKIFQLALDKLQLPANQVVFVDDMAQNVAAANLLGMHGIVFTSTAQTIKDINVLLVKSNY